ncbi:MAG TPA: copper resistance CopC family protein, partial [Acidimicrobiia bacterium]|nr:copper resistance CopC family protein [Acidimicrobiia bacterium]
MLRLGFVALIAAAGVSLTPAAGWAHADLVSSQPGYGDRLATAPAEVRLDFSGAVDLTGARVTLQRKGSGRPTPLQPKLATPDRRVVSVALPGGLVDGGYTMVWFFLGKDGHLMGGEVPFAVGAPAEEQSLGTPAPGVMPAAGGMMADTGARTLGPGVPGPVLETNMAEAAPSADRRRQLVVAVGTPQAVVRVLDYTGIVVLIGGAFFLCRVWSDGVGNRRAQRLLWAALVASSVATLLTFGLTAAGLRGVSALDALDPPVLAAVLGTRFSRVMAARAGFLGLAFVVLAMLALGREGAVRS